MSDFLQGYLSKTSILLPTIFCGLVLGGCQPAKVNQCNVLNQITNTGKSLPIAQNSGDFTQLADRLDRLNGEVEAIVLEDRNLDAFKNKYSQIYKTMARSSRQIAAPNTDQNLLNQAQQNLKTSANQEISLVTEVNKYCSHN
jgi:uncharacterized membrane-anchored protein YhcB (DUF1043 family)